MSAAAPLLVDGGTGSELQRRGVPADAMMWYATAALTHYDTLVAVHRDFIDAGARLITTNTFSTHRFVLDAGGLGTHFAAINTAAVSAARAAIGADREAITLAGAMSCMPPAFDTDNYPPPDVERAAYVELAGTLARLGVDVLLLEMMQDTRHAGWALDAALATGLPVWLGLSCRIHPTTGRLVGFDFPDVEFEAYFRELLAYVPAAVAIMHSPSDAVDLALPIVKAAWTGSLGAYPEVGAYDPVSRTRSGRLAPAKLAARAAGWLEQEITFIGGCCGSTPAHTSALGTMLEQHQRTSRRP